MFHAPLYLENAPLLLAIFPPPVLSRLPATFIFFSPFPFFRATIRYNYKIPHFFVTFLSSKSLSICRIGRCSSKKSAESNYSRSRAINMKILKKRERERESERYILVKFKNRVRFDARSFLSISPARWILAATKSPIDQDTASVFMEMRSWPQPVKDRESVLLRRAVSRHTPHDGWPDRCTCFGKRIWSDHLTLLPILSVSLTPPVPPIPPRFELDSNSRSRAIEERSRVEKIIFPTGRTPHRFLPSSSTPIEFSLANEERVTK